MQEVIGRTKCRSIGKWVPRREEPKIPDRPIVDKPIRGGKAIRGSSTSFIPASGRDSKGEVFRIASNGVVWKGSIKELYRLKFKDRRGSGVSSRRETARRKRSPRVGETAQNPLSGR